MYGHVWCKVESTGSCGEGEGERLPQDPMLHHHCDGDADRLPAYQGVAHDYDPTKGRSPKDHVGVSTHFCFDFIVCSV